MTQLNKKTRKYNNVPGPAARLVPVPTPTFNKEECYSKTVNKIKIWLTRQGMSITLFAFFILLIAAISKYMEIYQFAYLVSNVGWIFSRFFLVTVSITAISLWFSMKKNLWLDAGMLLFLAPL